MRITFGERLIQEAKALRGPYSQRREWEREKRGRHVQTDKFLKKFKIVNR